MWRFYAIDMWRSYAIDVTKPYGEVRDIPYRWLAVEGVASWLLDLSCRRGFGWLNYLGLYRLASWLFWKSDQHEVLVTRVELTAEQVESLYQDMFKDYEDE